MTEELKPLEALKLLQSELQPADAEDHDDDCPTCQAIKTIRAALSVAPAEGVSSSVDKLRRIIADEWGSHVCYHDSWSRRSCRKDNKTGVDNEHLGCRCEDIAKAIVARQSPAVGSEEPRQPGSRPETPKWQRRWPHDQPNGWNLKADEFLGLVKSAGGMMWLALSEAKYIELRVDTRDCGFNLYDRDGKPLNPDAVVEAVEKVKRDYGAAVEVNAARVGLISQPECASEEIESFKNQRDILAGWLEERDAEIERLRAQVERHHKTVDILEANARVQAKLLADTGRKVEQANTEIVRAARSTVDDVMRRHLEEISRTLTSTTDSEGTKA